MSLLATARTRTLIGLTALAVGLGPACSDPAAAPVPASRKAVCFAPGTSPAYMAEVEARQAAGKVAPFIASDFARWSVTATDGFKSAQGSPITLTWSIVPDGTRIPEDFVADAGNSDLRGFLTSIYGNEAAWLEVFQKVFDRWGELCGVTYVHEPNDDRAAIGTATGQLGVRADIRIGGKAVDGDFGVLAYNSFPNDGDMVIDTTDAFFRNRSQNSRRLRNVIAHEHGHGLALDHVCPLSNTKLMEPRASTRYDGPQLDDIIGAQRLYGDRFEPNEQAGGGAELLPLDGSRKYTVGTVSIDDDSDVDIYSFDAPEGAYIDVTLKPTGARYRSGPQESDGACGSTAEIETRTQADLRLALLGSDGSVFASVNDFGRGLEESLTDVPLPEGAGRYYVRVRNSGENRIQMYELSVKVEQRGEKPSAVPDVAETFEVLPAEIDVLANDEGLADEPITVKVVEGPAVGKVKLEGNRLVYVPPRGFTGAETFSYKVTDVHQQLSMAQVEVVVQPSARAGGARIDTDGDRYPDEFEAQESTLVGDAESRPGEELAGSGRPLEIRKLKITLKPQKVSSDKLALRGMLPVPEAFEPGGKAVVVSIGGVHRRFTLDATGRSLDEGEGSFRLRVKRKKGVVQAGDARFDVALRKDELGGDLVDEGLDSSRRQKAEPRALTVLLLFDGHTYERTLPLKHTAKPGKTGKAKIDKSALE